MFPFTFPRWVLVKVCMFWKFGTPKSPIMFNIMLTALAFSLRPQNSTYRTTQPGDLSVPLTGNGDIAKRMVALLYEKKMLLLILILVYTGSQQAFIWLVLFHYSLLTGTFSYASPTLEI
jgi:hypothetical protein